MPDYKEMYLKMFRVTEKVINELIAVQQECEEMYLRAEGSEMKVLSFEKEKAQKADSIGHCL